MNYIFAWSAFLCFCLLISNYQLTASANLNSDQKQPLILTSLIKDGKIEEARAAAEVKLDDFKNVKSYSGYFTVNQRFNSNLFFWFFPSTTNYANSPVLLLLGGGPGESTLIEIFMGNGPFALSDSSSESGKNDLTQKMSVIYIDNPVGTGYSFTDEDGYAQNQTIVGAQLYEALLQFFQLFPELQDNHFFVGGASYAGKYVPAISYTIHKNNPKAERRINLQGLVIGNGLVDPIHQMHFSEYLFQVGLIDLNGLKQMKTIENDIVIDIENERWKQAYETYNSMLIGNDNKSSLYSNLTGFKNFHNYLIPTKINILQQIDLFQNYITSYNVKSAIHVVNITYEYFNTKVHDNLSEDIPQSVALWLSELLGHYRVLIYNGQLDVVCAYPLTVNYLKKLNFSGADPYKTAIRHKWYVGNDLAGYIKQAENLTEVLVRNASHAVQLDKPRWLLDLITKHAYNDLSF